MSSFWSWRGWTTGALWSKRWLKITNTFIYSAGHKWDSRVHITRLNILSNLKCPSQQVKGQTWGESLWWSYLASPLVVSVLSSLVAPEASQRFPHPNKHSGNVWRDWSRKGLSSERFVQQQPVGPHSGSDTAAAPLPTSWAVFLTHPDCLVKLRHDPKSLFTPCWNVQLVSRKWRQKAHQGWNSLNNMLGIVTGVSPKTSTRRNSTRDQSERWGWTFEL